MKNKYYGPNKIKESKIIGDSVMLTLNDDKVVEISGKMAEVAVTDEKKDLTELRDLRCQSIAKEMLELIRDWDVKIAEVEYITTLTITSLNENIVKATEKLWGVSNEERTTKTVDKVLKNEG